MSCFYKRNKIDDIGGVIHEPKYYNSEFVQGTITPNENSLESVINVVLGTIGLSFDDVPCGKLPKYDIHNMGATQVLKLGLLEGVKGGNFYELYLNESGSPIILTTGEESFSPGTVYYSVTHSIEKVDYCVIVKGLDPMPERVVKEEIKLIENGIGSGVEVYGLGMFQYSTCGNKIFDYNGCISYADPNLQDTTKDEMDSAFELEPFESLIGYVFTCKKPEDVDVNFSDTSQIPVEFCVGELGDSSNLFLSDRFVDAYVAAGKQISVDVTQQDIDGRDAGTCDPCRFFEIDELNELYVSNTSIISVDQVIYTAERITRYKSTNIGNEDTCDVDVDAEGGEAAGASDDIFGKCLFYDTNIVTRQLNIGQDFYYSIDAANTGTNSAGSDMVTYTLSAGVAIAHLIHKVNENYVAYAQPSSLADLIHLAGSSSHIFIPFNGIALITIDKPAVYVNRKTSSAIGNMTSTGAAVVRDHTEEIEEIAKEITLTATPIVTLDKPSNTAYYVAGHTTLIDMADCIQDSDPRTVVDLMDTPCELMEQATSGKATINVTLPFLETDEEITDAATLLGNKFSDDYAQSVSTIPGNDISASDLGKMFNGGIINKIVWSYQDKSFYKASVTSGSFLTGVDSFNTSMWIRHTDQSLSREGIVIGDHGNGLEFKVYVRNIGTYTALNMTMATIEVGDSVNVTIYNNPAEAYYE